MGTKTVEDYLKAIYELQATGARAKTSQLAHKLAVTAGTVTEMIKRLAQDPPAVLTYKQHHGVRLTPQGERMALNVIRRHRLLETFLHQSLGLTWDEVHQEAEILEHCLSERVTEALDQFLHYPEIDPHGEPIPDAQGRIPAISNLALSALGEGFRFRVVRVQPVTTDLLQYLQTEQIHIGTTGTLLARAAFDGLVTLELETGATSHTCVLSPKVSDRIFVETLVNSVSRG